MAAKQATEKPRCGRLPEISSRCGASFRMFAFKGAGNSPEHVRSAQVAARASTAVAGRRLVGSTNQLEGVAKWMVSPQLMRS